MTVTFASLRRWNPELRLELVTNEPTVSTEFQGMFARLGVEIRLEPFNHRPPHNFYKQFAASLYMLDALRAAKGFNTMFIDPDVLCIRPIEPLINSILPSIGGIEIDYKPDYEINGLSRFDAGELHQLLGESRTSPTHYGGEFYLIPDSYLAEIQRRVDLAWNLSLLRHQKGESRFTTEEHIMSFALRGLPVANTPLIRRIWTAAKHRTVDGNEKGLTLWHLPAEKDRGFANLYDSAADERSWFWHVDRDVFAARCSKAFGFQNRSAVRLIRDTAGAMLSSLGH